MKIIQHAIFALALSSLPLAALAEGPGQVTFDKSCATCHGKDGRGNPAKAKMFKLDPDKLNLGRDEVASQTRDEKRAITASGKGKMPSYEKKLSGTDLDAVVDHVMELITTIRGK